MYKRKIFKQILAVTLLLLIASLTGVSAQTVPKLKKVRTVSNHDIKTKDSHKKIILYPRRTSVHHQAPRNLPPGQAKKIYGEKSARDFAPGHQKKNYDSKKYKKGKGITARKK